MKTKIAVCIPTLNEQDTIANTANIIDVGLAKYYKDSEAMIVNSDNDSKDNTRANFLSTPTLSQKVYLKTHDIGKGNNILNFLKFCQKNNIDYAAMIDSDVKSLKPIWIKKLLNATIKQGFDYVTPVYRRNRFEGSTTNHFAMPIIYTFFGKVIRQPIGGEFAFNKKYIEYIIKQPVIDSTLQYGIDIFMTIHAIGGRFSIKEVELGKKIHNPSFTKIRFMPRQVMKSALEALSHYQPSKNGNGRIIFDRHGIDKSRVFKHKEEAKKMLVESLKSLMSEQKRIVKTINSTSGEVKFLRGETSVRQDCWPVILLEALSISLSKHNYDQIGEALSIIFLPRTIRLWFWSINQSADNVEKDIIDQAVETRRLFVQKIFQS